MTKALPSLAMLAGGLATRLHPITETIPKSLVEVAGKPFIVHQLEVLRRSGIDHVVLCVGYLGEMIQHVIGDGSAYNLRVEYSFDGPRLLGTAGALKRALPLLSDPFFVLYGDTYLECDYGAIAHAFVASELPALMTVFRNNNQWDRSNVIFGDNRVVAYDKRMQTPAMQHIDYGLGIFAHRVFDRVKSDAPADLADVYQDLTQHGKLAGFEVFRRFYEIGSHEGLAATRLYLTQ
jgi:N-acetyl-alpha-D-muramate 1-phosphate uridylyltransferase